MSDNDFIHCYCGNKYRLIDKQWLPDDPEKEFPACPACKRCFNETGHRLRNPQCPCIYHFPNGNTCRLDEFGMHGNMTADEYSKKYPSAKVFQ